MDTCSHAEDGSDHRNAQPTEAASPHSAAATAPAPGVKTRHSALVAGAGQTNAPLAATKATAFGASLSMSADVMKVAHAAACAAGGRHTDSPTPHARSMGSEATWGLPHDRERSRPRSFTPQPWISGTSGESSQIAEPALDRLRASPAPAGGPFAAQGAGGARGVDAGAGARVRVAHEPPPGRDARPRRGGAAHR